jgi:anti-sigma B factor antagonist
MPDKLKITLDKRAAGVAIAHFTGRLDFTSAQEARDQFTAAIAAGQRNLIVDLSKVGFVDSAGLGSLIGGMRAARQAGGDLRIADPSEQAKMLLSLTSLDQVLKVHSNIEEAVRGFS